jgi:TolB protein
MVLPSLSTARYKYIHSPEILMYVSSIRPESLTGFFLFLNVDSIKGVNLYGGKPKVIAYVYGGQGTMNIPSWSPDSKRIAFISNSDMPGTNVQRDTAGNK